MNEKQRKSEEYTNARHHSKCYRSHTNSSDFEDDRSLPWLLIQGKAKEAAKEKRTSVPTKMK
jgi:hypothetical protein